MVDYYWNSLMLLSGMSAFCLAFILYTYREWWVPHAEDLYYDIQDQIDLWRHGSNSETAGRYAFLRDRDAGFSSQAFDLSQNIEAQDTRAGLDPKAKKVIRRIMRRDPNISFDEARVLYTTSQFQRNGVGSDGRPLDPRAVFFS